MINQNHPAYKGTSSDYVNYGTRGESRKRFERERRAEKGFAEYDDVIKAYSRAIAMQRTGRTDTIPTEQDRDYAFKAWRAMERHIQENQTSDEAIKVLRNRLNA